MNPVGHQIPHPFKKMQVYSSRIDKFPLSAFLDGCNNPLAGMVPALPHNCIRVGCSFRSLCSLPSSAPCTGSSWFHNRIDFDSVPGMLPPRCVQTGLSLSDLTLTDPRIQSDSQVMGLDSEVVRMLIRCQREGVDFSSTLTLGCQHFFPGINETRQLLSHNDPLGNAANRISSQRPDSQSFWKYLGARQLVTMDASDYEGATWVHDLNQPVDLNKFPDRFSVVCDIGTLEHVFNYPQALKNSLDLVQPGGTFLGFTTMNNYSGHGFYQFSPELFYSVLTPQNGFAMDSVIAMEYGPGFRWYEVTDPEKLGSRANLINGYRVLLHVRAKKIGDCPVLQSFPQQSDYSGVWRGESEAVDKAGAVHGSSHSTYANWLLEHFPGLSRCAESLFYSFWNPKFNFSRNPAFRRIRNKNQ